MKLYIETSVPNMLVHDDAPEKKQITRLFADWLHLSEHEPFVSPVVFREIGKTQSPRRELLERTLLEFHASVREVAPEVELLAERYAEARIVPARFRDDLLHEGAA